MIILILKLYKLMQEINKLINIIKNKWDLINLRQVK